MIFPKDFEIKIGFSPLRKLLEEKCDTLMGRDLVKAMTFSSEKNYLIRELECVNEMKNLLISGISLPQFSFFNVAAWLKETQSPGSFLNVEQMFHAALTFETMKDIQNFFLNPESSLLKCQTLRSVFKDIPILQDLTKEIYRCIDKDGYVKDSASPRLQEIRGAMDSISRSMHKLMRRVLDHFVNQGIIEKDTTSVLREGRMVIPVSSTNKRNIPGIVHDISATGKTVFIEPSELVEAGNRLRELQRDEEEEIIAILISLTDIIRPHYDDITRGCSLLAKYDFIKAKALFANETGGEKPVIEDYPELDWYHAVHPGLLLTLKTHGKTPVAMNLKLDEKNRILIISGPNAGGKSVSLKTVGTLQYMMQCGMLPSLHSNSHMGIFANIFIDIGDEQSMENDLSTYSSHLSNMKFFLQNVDKKTLILVDEMGSGTEPQIGAALAQAIIIQLCRSGCMGVITTHYQNLKILAEKEDGLINGAMMYDRVLLRPTFQLSVGEPGSSFALEIARNIGLPRNVIESAKDIVGSEYVDAERFTLDIQRDKRYWKNKRIEIKEKENRLNRLLEEYEQKADELKHQRSSILKEARLEAKEILQGANTQIERSIHEIRKSQAEKEKSKAVRKELEDYKKSLETDLSQDHLPDSLKPLKHTSRKKKLEKNSVKATAQVTKDLQPGDFVRMEDSGVTGTVISTDGKQAEVAFGNLRTKIDITKLQKASKPKNEIKNTTVIFTQSSSDSESRKRQLNFKNEIDVRGLRADEALQAITYFLDDAVQFNASKVRILHGTGHGILKTIIRQQLNTISHVKEYHDEDVRFGGAGITVVELE